MAEVAVAEEVEEVAEEAEEAQQRARQPQEEETRNSSERNHPHSMEIDKTSTDSFRIFRDICL